MVDIGRAKGHIFFGDGIRSLYYGHSPMYKDVDDNLKIKVCVSPTKEVRWLYKIKEQLLTEKFSDGERGMWIEYNATAFRPLKIDFPTQHFITSNFDATRSKYEMDYEEKNLQIQELYKKLSMKDIEIYELKKRIDLLTGDMGAYTKTIAKTILPLQDKNAAMNTQYNDNSEAKQ